MSGKKYGLSYERKEKAYLESQGYNSFRCRGSFSYFDIVSFNDDGWLMTSVKSTRKKKVTYKKEIEKIKNAKVPMGTMKRVVVYNRGKRFVAFERQSEGYNPQPLG